MQNRPGGERSGGEDPRPEQPDPGDPRSAVGPDGTAGPPHAQHPRGHQNLPPPQPVRPPAWGQAPPAPPYARPGHGTPAPRYAPGPPGRPHHGPAPQGAPGGYGAQAGTPAPGRVQPGGYPATGWQQPGPPWGGPRAARPRRRGLGVLVGSSVAAVIALVALAASILMVATTPREEPRPNGTDLSELYDDRLAARPNEVEVDVVGHPLYTAAVPEAVECEVPDLDMGSDSSWEEFATAAGACLDELWAPVMEELGLSVAPLEFAVTQDSPDSDTEEGYTLAYYESDLARITVVLPNVRHMGAQIPRQYREDVWLALMGHEYGHHVQHVTGILGISHDMRWTAGSEEEELDTLRRTELQAECLAGVGLRGVTDADEEVLEAVNANLNNGGDLDTHGSARNRAFWMEQGWSESTVSCDTYDADPDQVT